MLEYSGGSALLRKDSREASLREAREETGLLLEPACGKLVITLKRKDNLRVYGFFRPNATPVT